MVWRRRRRRRRRADDADDAARARDGAAAGGGGGGGGGGGVSEAEARALREKVAKLRGLLHHAHNELQRRGWRQDG